MAAQLGLPAALKARGLTVELVPGWETRSAGSFAPKGAICHWTAGPAKSTTRPSLNIVVNGRPDLDGPLCNVYLDRNGIAVVVAAGRANHAGAGNWRGLTANSQLFGTECEAAGPDDFTPAQRLAYPKVNAAYCDLGGFGADMVAGHSEYALPKGRKTDINGYTMDDMRQKVAAILAGQTPGPIIAEEDLDANQAKMLQTVYDALTPGVAGVKFDGDILARLKAVQATTVSILPGVSATVWDVKDGGVRMGQLLHEGHDAAVTASGAVSAVVGNVGATPATGPVELSDAQMESLADKVADKLATRLAS